jgi:transposase
VQDDRDRRVAELEKEVADLRTMVKALLADNARLQAENDDLRAQLGKNSSNSSKPPSTDSPADRELRRGKAPSGKKRGGQPGHKGSQRELLTPTRPPVDCFPKICRRCDSRLPRQPDPDPLRHQTVDLPQIEAEVLEWRLHRVTCDCGAVTCGVLPPGISRSMCAPGLTALIALLTGDHKMPRRRAVSLLSDVLGIEISLGALSEAEETASEAVAAPVAVVRDLVADAPIKHADATGWRQGNQARTLWTIASAAVTVFFITKDGSMAGLRGLFAKIKGILVSDRGKQFGFWAMDQRQICWAHLIRRFTDFAERSGAAGDLGKGLLLCAETVIHWWHRVRDGTMSRPQFQAVMESMGYVIERHLENGVRLGIRGVSGSCADILAHRAALWTFVRISSVQPTNNEAERALRGFVLWRKTSFGTQSDRGSRFAERIMTVTHTLRKQRRHVFSYLRAACQASLRGELAPPLVISTP